MQIASESEKAREREEKGREKEGLALREIYYPLINTHGCAISFLILPSRYIPVYLCACARDPTKISL